MKRAWLSLLVMAPLALAGCSSPGPAGGGGSGASNVATSTDFVSLAGVTHATFDVSANGSWTAATSQDWLTLSPTAGSGPGTVTVAVDRSQLAAGSYLGAVLVKGSTGSAAVAVFMRFAQVSGNVTGPSGKILPAGMVGSAPDEAAGTTSALAQPFVPGEVLVRLADAYVALRASPGQARTPGSSLLAGAAVQGWSPRTTGIPIAQSQVGGSAPDAAIVRAAVTDVARAHGLRVRSLIAPSSSWAVLDTGGRSVAEAVAAVGADPRVAAVQPNYLQRPTSLGALTPQAVPDDSLAGLQWDMALLGMDDAWDVATGSADVVVGVLDSGVMATHPDLQGNTPYGGYDFVLDRPGAVTPLGDGSYHGTHVAGTIGAVGNNGAGVAGMDWRVAILPVRVCEAAGCSTAAVVRGLQYAAGFPVYDGNDVLVTPPVRAQVINMSLGGTVAEPVEEEAVALVTGAGISVVVSSGNDGAACTSPPSFAASNSPSPVMYPAAFAGVIAVGSVDWDAGTGQFAASCFSDGGPRLWVAAPGGWLFENGVPHPLNGMPDASGYGALGIVSTSWDAQDDAPAYLSDEGTSMAAPHVAGLVALMLSENPELTPTDVKLLLAGTAIGLEQHDDFLGYGLVSPAAAVAAARDAVTANASDFSVSLWQGDTLVRQARADAGGGFVLPDVPAGRYTVAAGNDRDHDGQLGEAGEFFGAAAVTVGDDGDVTGVGLNVELR